MRVRESARPLMSARRTVLVAAVAASLSAGSLPVAHAMFRDSAGAGAALSTSVLAPPTGAALQRTCTLNLLLIAVSSRLTATWTPSASGWATSQRVLLRNSGGTVLGDSGVLGVGVGSAVFDLLLPVGSHTVTITTTYRSWTSQTTASAPAC